MIREKFIILLSCFCFSCNIAPVKADVLDLYTINRIYSMVSDKLNGVREVINDNINPVVCLSVFFAGSLVFSVYLQEQFSQFCCDGDGSYHMNNEHDLLCSLPRVGGDDDGFALLRYYCPVPLDDGTGRMVVPRG